MLGLDEHATDDVDEEEGDQNEDGRNGIELQASPSGPEAHNAAGVNE